MLYINGDSNAAGAEAVNPHGFAADDSQYWRLGRRPHPDNEAVCWGTRLAEALGWERYNDSESAASNYRILRTTNEYLKTNRPDAIVIGWTTWEREEWWYRDRYYQVNGSGQDMVDSGLRDRYRAWVLSMDETVWEQKELFWHEQIWGLHQRLIDDGIPHLFFNCYSKFNSISYKLEHLKKDWQGRFIGPYEQEHTYYDWLLANEQKTVAPGSYHFGKEAHQKWAEFLYPQLTKIL
jgi:hypothetical protein